MEMLKMSTWACPSLDLKGGLDIMGILDGYFKQK